MWAWNERMKEEALCFDCQGSALVGILHRPETPGRRGVLVIVGGGPQYRAGGHRQLTLWSRRLAAEGYPVLRFDYRGMGDAHGDFRGFEHIGEDIDAAIATFRTHVPELEEVVLWGECDASSAILFHAHRHPGVGGAVLLNPWVRTEAGEARAILRFYYLQRLTQASFWKKVFSFKFNPLASVASALGLLSKARSTAAPASPTAPGPGAAPSLPSDRPLPERLLFGMTRFKGKVMLVMSGRDLIAREFDDLVKNSPAWQAEFAAKPVTRFDFAEADHTFSSAAQREQVVNWGLAWLRSW